MSFQRRRHGEDSFLQNLDGCHSDVKADIMEMVDDDHKSEGRDINTIQDLVIWRWPNSLEEKMEAETVDMGHLEKCQRKQTSNQL